MAAWPAMALAVAAAAAGSAPGRPPAPATAAQVEAEYQRQRGLCQALTVAAVRAECLRQAERSRAQALKRLQRPGPVSGSSGRSG